MNAARLLEVLRDARDEGLWQAQADVLRQLDIDCKHVRFEVRNRPLMPRMRTEIDYEDDDEDGNPAPIVVPPQEEIDEDNHQRRVRKALEWKRADWLAWSRRACVTSLNDIYKRMYSDARVSSLPTFTRTHPLFQATAKE